MKISLRQATKLVLYPQLYEKKLKHFNGKEKTFEIINHLGYIQIDTISVINRAHHHTLWIRQPGYNKELLLELQAKDKLIFEYWGHAASYLPMKDYRFYIPLMKSIHKRNAWMGDWIDRHRKYMKSVLRRIKTEGPLTSKDFKPKNNKKRGPWWDWHEGKATLETLFWTGKLMITERRKFQKVYDLTERVLPDWVNLKTPLKSELGRFLITRALNSYGLALKKEIAEHIPVAKKDLIYSTIKSMLNEGRIKKVEVEGIKDKEYLVLKESLESFPEFKFKKNDLFLLSPFDNIVILRNRIRTIFRFDYTIECYVPPKKRKYGYFSLPILWKDKFIGRLDSKADRKTKTFLVRNLIFEPEFKEFDNVIPVLVKKIRTLAEFNSCSNIKV